MVMESLFRNPGNFFTLESGMQVSIWIRNTALGIQNPTQIGMQTPSYTDKGQESSTWNPDFMR